MGWRVRYNNLGAVAKAMPQKIDEGVDELAEAMALRLKGTLWRDTGMVRRVTVDKPEGVNHAEVWIGYNRDRGFYSRFNEWGTVKMHARPIVGPTAHQMERQYALEMAQQVREACNAR